jgi:flagellar hook assembly protein FlgD
VAAASTQSTKDFLDAIAPNPFSENTSLRFTVDGGTSNVIIEIFDVTGRRVRSLIDRPLTRGTHVIGWDSRDDRGSRVATGTYFARLTVNGRAASGKKMTVLR